MARISVADAAKRLGVHVQRVHQRIADGSLPAEKVGRHWVIDEHDVSRLDKRPGGRPPSARSAWNVIAVADEANSLDLPAGQRAAAEQWLRRLQISAAHAPDGEAVAELRRLLRNRADRHGYHASPRDLPDLRVDSRVRLSGISDPESRIASADVVEGYIVAAELADVVAEYLLVPVDGDAANVVVHVYHTDAVREAVLRRPNTLLVAADLAEHHGPRESARALELVRQAGKEHLPS
ncbi:MAG: helix-turn-helix domain-containing protein [Dermatophilaceae bacterium]